MRFLSRRSDSRAWYRCLLLDCHFRPDACWGADKSQRDFANGCHEYCRECSCGYPSHTQDHSSRTSDYFRSIPDCHTGKSNHNNSDNPAIVLRTRRNIFNDDSTNIAISADCHILSERCWGTQPNVRRCQNYMASRSYSAKCQWLRGGVCCVGQKLNQW